MNRLMNELGRTHPAYGGDDRRARGKARTLVHTLERAVKSGQ